MNSFSLIVFIAIVGLTLATNKTQSANQTSSLVNNDDDDDNFYVVNVLLTEESVSTLRSDQNETDLSVRLTARDGTVSSWYRLYTNNELNPTGQHNYYLPEYPRDLGLISSISLRFNKSENLTAASIPYLIRRLINDD